VILWPKPSEAASAGAGVVAQLKAGIAAWPGSQDAQRLVAAGADSPRAREVYNNTVNELGTLSATAASTDLNTPNTAAQNDSARCEQARTAAAAQAANASKTAACSASDATPSVQGAEQIVSDLGIEVAFAAKLTKGADDCLARLDSGPVATLPPGLASPNPPAATAVPSAALPPSVVGSIAATPPPPSNALPPSVAGSIVATATLPPAEPLHSPGIGSSAPPNSLPPAPAVPAGGSPTPQPPAQPPRPPQQTSPKAPAQTQPTDSFPGNTPGASGPTVSGCGIGTNQWPRKIWLYFSAGAISTGESVDLIRATSTEAHYHLDRGDGKIWDAVLAVDGQGKATARGQIAGVATFGRIDFEAARCQKGSYWAKNSNVRDVETYRLEGVFSSSDYSPGQKFLAIVEYRKD